MFKLTKKNIGLFAVLILSVFPVIRWAMLTPLNLRFLNLGITMNSFGQIAGLLGMTLFSLNLILASRLKFLDNFFYGLHNVYNFHRRIGAISFSLILFHPLFLVIKYLQISLRSAALFFIPFQDKAITFGIMALILMMILIILTLYVKMKYHYWKISHKFMVVAFIFALLHLLYTRSDISLDNTLKFYIFGLGIMGLTLGFYRAFLSKFLNKKFKYKVAKVIKLNKEVIEIELEPINRNIEFEPGQFIFISFISKRVSSEIHPFSVSSAASGENLKLVIKSLGDFTSELNNLEAGEMARLEGPFGKFSYKNVSSKNQIWLAGGVGITPFLSMARSLGDDGYKIDLYYCVKNQEEAVLANELSVIGSIYKNFKFILWYSDDKGFINGKIVSESSNGLENKDIFLCGPTLFMKNLKDQFLELKVNVKNIHWEEFKFI